ncbi:hypothetical protein PSPO01_06152 [Paraphaeosphaeria sporulosa]
MSNYSIATIMFAISRLTHTRQMPCRRRTGGCGACLTAEKVKAAMGPNATAACSSSQLRSDKSRRAGGCSRRGAGQEAVTGVQTRCNAQLQCT